MYFKKFVILIFFMSAASLASAQSWNGRIESEDTGMPLSGVDITNLQTLVHTVSNKDGNFYMPVATGQTVTFSLPGYEKVFLKVENKMDPVIKMKVQEYTLDSVVISPGLTAYQVDSVARYNTYKNDLEWKKIHAKMAITPIGVAVQNPVSSWMQYIAPRTRKRMQFQRKFSQWEKEQFNNSRYNIVVVQDLTQLSADSAGLFISQFPIDNEYARAATDTEIKMWIMNNYKMWVKK